VTKKERDRLRSAAFRRNYPERARQQHAIYRAKPEKQKHEREYGKGYRRTTKGRFLLFKYIAINTRHISFDLTLAQYAALITGAQCHYCGGNLPMSGSGLDRKKSSLGYSTENCVPCCRRCNEIRGRDNISYLEMFEVIKLLRTLRPIPYGGRREYCN